MCKVEGYWNVVPKIKKVSFPMRGKMAVQLEDGRLIITVSGYPARYTNFRVATTEDTDLAREAQMFKNDLGNDVVSTPVK